MPLGENRIYLFLTIWPSSDSSLHTTLTSLDVVILDALVTVRIIALPVPAVLS
jgi:hypothetical protein